MQKTRKRGKDKKRTKSESNIVLNLPGTAETLDNVNAYIGVPLVGTSFNNYNNLLLNTFNSHNFLLKRIRFLADAYFNRKL